MQQPPEDFLPPSNPTASDLDAILNQPHASSASPKSFKNTMKKARDSFMRSEHPEFQPSESLELENLIRGDRKSTMKWPTVRDWGYELYKNPRLAINSVVGGIIVATVTVPQSMAYCKIGRAHV